MLSSFDIAGAQQLYGRRGNDFLWEMVGNVRDLAGAPFDALLFRNTAQSHSGHSRPFSGDFSGSDDIYWYAPGTGRDFMWFGRASGVFDQSVTAKAFNHPGTFIPLSGDFNGDTRGDIFWYQAGSGQDYLWWVLVKRGAFTETKAEVSGTFKPVVGDFDGDGTSDIEWYGVGSATDYTWFGSPGGFIKNTNFRQVSGDGTDDIYWYTK